MERDEWILKGKDLKSLEFLLRKLAKYGVREFSWGDLRITMGSAGQAPIEQKSLDKTAVVAPIKSDIQDELDHLQINDPAAYEDAILRRDIVADEEQRNEFDDSGS